jgi:polo-like kinase 1
MLFLVWVLIKDVTEFFFDSMSFPPPVNHTEEVIEEYDPRTGKILTRYLKGKLLGKGGFAKCYEFTDLASGRTYACKLIEKKSLAKPKTQQKLRSEVKIHSSLRHPYIVKFEHFFEDTENVYLLLEICTQQTMMELLKRKRRLDECEVTYLMKQTFEGVKYMHDRSIIHRDLKLGNLFLSDKMEVKIGDFGLAAQLEFDGERKLTVCGTPNYIAPEILDGGKHGHSFEVDIWSLGVILYTLLVGKPPFETADIKMTYHKIRHSSYTFPDDVGVSYNAKRLIQRILQSNPECRPSLADIIADPFFTHRDIPYACPSTLWPTGMPAGAKDHSTAPSRPKSSPMKSAAARPRDPLKAITNVPEPHQASKSPTSGRHQPSPPHVRPRTVEDLPKAALDPASQPKYTSNGSGRHPAAACSTPRDAISAGVSKAVGGMADIQDARLVPEPCGPPAPVELPVHDVVQHKQNVLDEEDKQNLTQMHQNLSMCIQHAPQPVSREIPTIAFKPSVWVTEYSDFTAKYGLAYRLSYGHIGAAFNDGTKMVWDSLADRVEYLARNREKADVRSGKPQEERTVCKTEDFPESLKKKITLITYFRSYFAKYRGKNVTYPIVQANPATNHYQGSGEEPCLVYVKQWMRHSHALVFRLSNRCFQVSFFDGADILLSSEAKLVTYTDPKGQSKTFALEAGKIQHSDFAERLEYTQKILFQIMHK